MSNIKNLSRLTDLAQLMLDHQLSVLRSSSDRLEQSRMQLSTVNQAAQPVDFDPIISTRVGLQYDRWADVRRSELNLVISRQTADWLEARGEAQTAFGRVQALNSLTTKLGEKLP